MLLADARELASVYDRTDAHILRRALKIGMTELREDSRKPTEKQEVTNDRRNQ